ncbi:40s ribosomal protein S15 [Ranunculus cassubicifolius]
MSLDVMLIPKATTLIKLIKRRLLFIEPARISIKWDGLFIMYQTIAMLQVHKSKYQTYKKKINVDNKAISQEEKKENKGSVEFQVFSFTNKIRRLTSHLELHRKDFLSQRGLRKILGKRQRLLAYLSKKNKVRYKQLISNLSIRELKTR